MTPSTEVEQLVEVEPVAEGRDQHRKHARAGDRRLEILLRRGVPGVVVELAHVGRNGDEWLGMRGLSEWHGTDDAHKIGDRGGNSNRQVRVRREAPRSHCDYSSTISLSCGVRSGLAQAARVLDLTTVGVYCLTGTDRGKSTASLASVQFSDPTGRNSWIVVHSSRKAGTAGVGAAAATALAAPAIAQIEPEGHLAPDVVLPEVARHDLWRRRSACRRCCREATDGNFQIQVFAGRRNRSRPAGGRRGGGRHGRGLPHGRPTITGARTRPGRWARPCRSRSTRAA